MDLIKRNKKYRKYNNLALSLCYIKCNLNRIELSHVIAINRFIQQRKYACEQSIILQE